MDTVLGLLLTIGAMGVVVSGIVRVFTFDLGTKDLTERIFFASMALITLIGFIMSVAQHYSVYNFPRA